MTITLNGRNGATDLTGSNGEQKLRSEAKTTTAAGRPVPPDPEVTEKARRRRFTAEYKLRILEQVERCAPGEQGALLRREGLYSSHLTAWRRQRAAGQLRAASKTATKANLDEALRRAASVERENRRLRQRLQRAETIITVQKKLAGLLGLGPQGDGSN